MDDFYSDPLWEHAKTTVEWKVLLFHGSRCKGLEFQAVILYTLLMGSSPQLVCDHSRKRRRTSSSYVAMTRAKEHLIFYVPYKQPWGNGFEQWQDPHLPALHSKRTLGWKLTK